MTQHASPSFPENFALLHRGEEKIRQENISAIVANPDMALHFDAIERAMNLIEYFSRAWETDDNDDHVLQLLGARLFNGASASINLVLSGYYQASASLAREVLETSFLVDLLSNDRKRVERWRTAPNAERRKEFSPQRVREALDRRDGFESKARAEHYSLLSGLASHPTPQGFRMLRPGPNQLAKIGPFFNQETLSAVAAELGRIVVPAASHFRRHFEPRTTVLLDFEVLLHYIEGIARWRERFLGKSYDPHEIEEVRRSISFAKKPSGQ